MELTGEEQVRGQRLNARLILFCRVGPLAVLRCRRDAPLGVPGQLRQLAVETRREGLADLLHGFLDDEVVVEEPLQGRALLGPEFGHVAGARPTLTDPGQQAAQGVQAGPEAPGSGGRRPSRPGGHRAAGGSCRAGPSPAGRKQPAGVVLGQRFGVQYPNGPRGLLHGRPVHEEPPLPRPSGRRGRPVPVSKRPTAAEGTHQPAADGQESPTPMTPTRHGPLWSRPTQRKLPTGGIPLTPPAPGAPPLAGG